MSFNSDFGPLGEQLITLLRSGPPDLKAAEELLRQGADLNAGDRPDGENILSEILSNYWWSKHGDTLCADCKDPAMPDCSSCTPTSDLNPDVGAAMCAIIRFFLAHGFDVTKNGGLYGARCLWELTLSSRDRYMIEAIKLLLDAGAQNISVSPTNPYETPQDFINMERSFQSCEGAPALANIYEAAWLVYEAQRCGRPYAGIDSYELAVGKRILQVLAEDGDGQPVFYPLSLPEFKKEHCFTKTLYLVYEDGLLICDQYGSLWTDRVLPDCRLTDVSGCFPGVVGASIREISIKKRTVRKDRTYYGQPVTVLHMDSGRRLKLSINFGEAEEKDRAAYFELLR